MVLDRITRALRRVSLYTAALAAAISTVCSAAPVRSPSAPPQAAGAPPAAVTPVRNGPPLELEIAARWLEALRSRDMERLTGSSEFPIEFRDTKKQGHCEARRSAADVRGLARAVECLTEDELLMSLMHDKPGVPPVETQPEGRIKPWAEAWGPEVPAGSRAISSYYGRTDAWISIILWVDSRGVRAVWKDGTDVRAEAALAERWRTALRERNVQELTRLASYPFELRDEGVNAHCKKGKTAKGPTEMPAALTCLLGDKVLNQALMTVRNLSSFRSAG